MKVLFIDDEVYRFERILKRSLERLQLENLVCSTQVKLESYET